MKKLISLLIAASLMLSFSACSDKTNNNSSAESNSKPYSEQENSDTASEEQSAEQSEEISDMTPVTKTYPYVTGTFIQPYAFSSFTDAQWDKHFEGLLEVGIDIMIIQWTSTTPHSSFSDVYYPSDYAEAHKASSFSNQSQMLERCLKSAEKYGVKVFVGLNIADEWWDINSLKTDWFTNQAEIGMISAGEIHKLYKEKYPNALAGWYFAWEMYNGMNGRETDAGNFLNMYLEPLTAIDPTMPLMLSPFVTSGGGSAEKAGDEWKKVFETANFRDGDIFCCQDAVGAGWITIDQLDDYFRELKAAVDTENGLRFWANNENFTKDFQSAPVDRFVKQMEISHKYVENHITFAYSHYYSKDMPGKAMYHKIYKKYYDTGVLPTAEISRPEVTFKSKDDGRLSVNVDIAQGSVGYTEIRITDASGQLLKKTPVTAAMQDRESLSFAYSIDMTDKISIEVTDLLGNSASFEFNVNIKD